MNASAKYRKMINKLAEKNQLIVIKRNGHKDFDLIINFEIVKNFKKRDSINKRIIKLCQKLLSHQK
jgi:hypothetical protein